MIDVYSFWAGDVGDEVVLYEDHIKAIQELKAEMELLKQGWISVDDRLPELCNYYLVHRQVRPDTTHIDVMFFDEGFDDTVTHWMPLPEPPKSEKIDC